MDALVQSRRQRVASRVAWLNERSLPPAVAASAINVASAFTRTAIRDVAEGRFADAARAKAEARWHIGFARHYPGGRLP